MNPENTPKYEIIDNEALNANMNLLEKKTNISIEEKTNALFLLNELDLKNKSDIDIAYSINKKEYYLILGNSDIIKNGDLSNETLEQVQYVPISGKSIDELREYIKLEGKYLN